MNATMLYRRLLAQRQLSVISGEPDFELRHLETIIDPHVSIANRTELDELLGELLHVDAPRIPRTLDLIGHTRDSLLMLGDWTIDAGSPRVTAVFRELADHDVLPRLGITAVRLLGCRTADTDRGRATICALADLLGVEVFGTTHLLYDTHYDATGFREKWQFLLIGSSELRGAANVVVEAPHAAPYTHNLDIDSLPAGPLDRPAGSRRFVTPASARKILELVRRCEGAQMPGLLAAPSYELAWPTREPEQFHLAHVFFDGSFVRFYPGGIGVLYPTHDARELQAVVEALPTTCGVTR